MREQTNTNSQFNDDVPDGVYDFRIEKVYGKDLKGKRAYEWMLDYKDADGNLCNGRILTWPNQIGPLLAILGATEVSKGKYEWDCELMEGKAFQATITHPTTKGGKVVCAMGLFNASKQDDQTPF
jgi:hypothetical protein